MKESDIQSLILIFVTSIEGSFFWRQNTGVFHDANGVRRLRSNIKGTPDILGTLKGRMVAIEVKTTVGRQSEAQKQWQRNCERAGGLYILARSVNDVEVALRKEGLIP